MVIFKMIKEKTKGRLKRAIANTAALDRDREVLLPLGCMVDDFKKNPVMLFIHDGRAVPVGKVEEIKVEKEQVSFSFEFSDTETGNELDKLYNDGFMNAFSVGFIPKQHIEIDSKQALESIEVNLPAGGKQKIDLTQYKEAPRRIYTEWELLEISPVSVPSNPEALLLRKIENIVDKGVNPAVKSIMQSELSGWKSEIDGLIKEMDSYEIKATIPYAQTPIEEAKWSGTDSKTALAIWASSDGSGDKDTIDWSKYMKGFTWFDAEKAGNLTSYKLPHHIISNGKLVGIWSGITTAMASLLGEKGGVDGGVDVGEDKEKVYNHLAQHYKDFDKVPPELKTGEEAYTETELEAIGDGSFTVENEGGGDSSSGDVDPDKDQNGGLLKELGELKELFMENLATVSIKLSILADAQENLIIKSKSKEEGKEKDKSVVLTDDVEKLLDGFAN